MAAERGHANAQFWLAQLLTSGQMKRDEKEARQWLRKSAEQGNIGAAETLGGMLRHNSADTKADHVEAAKWVTIAAKAGRLRAQFDLAEMLDQGHGMPQDYAEALRWYQRVAEGDHERYSRVVDAWLRLGEMYYQGLGTSKDLNTAREWFLQCAEDQPQARVYLGSMYEKGEGVPRDDKAAAEQYERAFLRGGTTAFEPLVSLYIQKRAYPNDTNAVRNQILQLGRVRTLLDSVRNYYLAGEMYRLGIVMSEDAGKAAELFNSAAALGSAEAQIRIGQFWQAGTSGQVDPKESVRWFQRAAMQGAAEAQLLLGRAYSSGDGVEQNIVTALKWTMLAARQKWEGAGALQAKLESSATPQETESARTQVNQFKPQSEPAPGRAPIRR